MIKSVFSFINKNRFEIFFISLVSILFGSLIVPALVYDKYLYSFLFVINILSGLLLIDKNIIINKILIGLFLTSLIIFGINPLIRSVDTENFRYVELVTYFVFYVVVTVELIRQVWHAKEVDRTVIFGLMSGYICLGLVGFFIFFSIEITSPGAFSGVVMQSGLLTEMVDSLMYYSFITLLTIGYGEIYPVSVVSQKAAILIGLAGQFYLVILTAIVVGKYIAQFTKSKN